jgi:hypothetical protein
MSVRAGAGLHPLSVDNCLLFAAAGWSLRANVYRVYAVHPVVCLNVCHGRRGAGHMLYTYTAWRGATEHKDPIADPGVQVVVQAVP